MSDSSSRDVTFVGSSAPAQDAVADLLFVPVFGADDQLGDVPGIDAAVAGELARARRASEFRAKPCEVFLARVVGTSWKAQRIAFIGAGTATADAEHIRRVAATAGYVARQRGAARVGFVARYENPIGAATHVADGLSAAEFDGGTYKTGKDAMAASSIRDVDVIVPGAEEAALVGAVRKGRIIGQAANFARALANEPGNVLTPPVFASRIAAGAAAVGLTTDVLDEARLETLGMRLLLGVAQGSVEPARCVVMRHDPPGAPDSPVIALVGKGVTFDTGGISIKPADGMERMKDDMAGAAAVTAAMRALALLHAPFRVIGVVPTCENMPGGKAIRPGDVIVGASGKSVEIINTDAEGRLILADALWYAKELGATHVIDVATLTGACLVALGRTVSGLFGSSDEWVDVVKAAASRGGDRVWHMPIYEETAEQLQSDIADLVNSAGRPGGAVTAAAFLREFAGGLPWAHLDIAGTAWAESKQPYQPKGATGVALRTLIELGMTGGRT